MHCVPGRHQKPLASWGCPVAPDQSVLRRHHEHPKEFGAAFSDGYREKRQGGLRQMPLRGYAEEFHHELQQLEKCREYNQDVDLLDSSGANQDIDDYLNYVLANGYLGPDLCKDIGIRELLSPNKCKTSHSGSSKYHCGHCCKEKIKDTSPKKGTSDISKKKSSDDTLNCGSFEKSKEACEHNSAGFYTPVILNSSIVCANHTHKYGSGKSKSLSEIEQKKTQKVEKETQSSPSTENTLMQTKVSASKDSIHWKGSGVEDRKAERLKRTPLEDILQSKSSANVGLKRETCPCSHDENFVRFTLSSSETESNCKETGL